MNDKSPVSPHLQVYRLPATAMASICHRGSGCALAALLGLGVPLALTLLATAPELFDALLGITRSAWFWPVQLALVATVVYHLLSGLRHLMMDLGFWLGKESCLLSARLLFVLTALASLFLVLWL